MGKLFGTDGIRGVVNDGLDAMLAFRVGMAAAQVMTREKGGGQPRFTIGKDTRISSDLLEGALIAGLCSAGADVLHLGVIPTPAVAWITVDTKADAGIVISASHNPFEHNGIKIFNGQGFKLSDELEEKIEEIVLGHPKNMDGTVGPRAEKCETLAKELEERTGLHVVLWDERRTTVAAHEILHRSGKKEKKHRQSVDAVAATLILQGYLDFKRRQ